VIVFAKGVGGNRLAIVERKERKTVLGCGESRWGVDEQKSHLLVVGETVNWEAGKKRS